MGDPEASRLDGVQGNAVILFFKETSIGGVRPIKALATLVSAFFIAIARTPEVARPKRGYSDSGDHFAFRASVTKATPEALGSDTAAAATI